MEITRFGDIDIVSIMGRVDSETAGILEKTLNSLVTAGSKKILCDFSATAYINSAGLRVLLSVTKALKRTQGSIVLCSLRPNVNGIFSIAGINQVVPVYSTREEAINKLSGNSGLK
jgi:anti-anti-sigma factor